MVVERREVWWADLDEPVLVVQADAFNRTRIQTVLVIILTSNLRLLDAPGNVLLRRKETKLPRDSVANVSQIVTLDRDYLINRITRIPASLMSRVDSGLKLVLDL